MEVRFMFNVELRCLMDLQNTVTYIGGEQTLAELGSTRGLGRIELISKESKYTLGAFWLVLDLLLLAIRGTTALAKCVPHLKKLIASGRPFGSAPTPSQPHYRIDTPPTLPQIVSIANGFMV